MNSFFCVMHEKLLEDNDMSGFPLKANQGDSLLSMAHLGLVMGLLGASGPEWALLDFNLGPVSVFSTKQRKCSC